MKAEIIAIGSELLTPHRSDTNSLLLTAALNDIGVEVVSKIVVGDDFQRLTDTIDGAWNRSEIVITIGGLGPTEDDLTRECVAKVLHREMHRSDEIVESISARFRFRGYKMPENNLRQAMIIDGAEVIPNTKGTAPGQWIEEQGKILLMLPGPPREIRPMFEEQCIPKLRKLVPQAFIRTKTLRMTGITESSADEIAAPIYTKYTNPVTTILSTLGEIQLHFRSTGKSDTEAVALLNELSNPVELALERFIYSINGESLEQVVGDLLSHRNATFAVAESCTGGMLAQRITSVPGSSSYFWGGVVSYSNQAKFDLLGVPTSMIESHGAVSGEVASAMAEGIRQRTGATYGAGITGVAGPGGGTEAKPVGLVFVALAGPDGTQVAERKFPGDREIVRFQSSQLALDLLRRALLGVKN